MLKGWIRLYRELLEKTIWLRSTARQKCVSITVLLLASYQANRQKFNGKNLDLKPGQFVTSLDSISSAAGKGISAENVRSALKRLEGLGFLTNESTNSGRLISVVNWNGYQSTAAVSQQSSQQADRDVRHDGSCRLMGLDGWIKLHRVLLANPVWWNSTAEQKCVLITVLLLVSHCEKSWEWGGKKFVVKPGEAVTSLASIMKKAGRGVSIQNVRSALKRFERMEFLTNESTKNGRLISIVNWDSYQSSIDKVQQSGQQSGNIAPAKPQHLSIKKEEKKCTRWSFKKKVTIPSDFHLTEQMRRDAARIGYTGDIEDYTARFISKCFGKCWKYSDWGAVWLEWLREEMEEKHEKLEKAKIIEPSYYKPINEVDVYANP